MKTIKSFISETKCTEEQKLFAISFWSKLVDSLNQDQIKTITAVANMMPSWAALEWGFDNVQYHVRHFCFMSDQPDLQSKVETVLFRIAGDYYFKNFKSES